MAIKKEAKAKGEELGVVGFILGILSIIFVGSNGIIIAIVGFFFCLVQQKRNPTRLGKIGMILNVIGFILAVVLIVLLLTVLKPYLAQLQANFPVQ